MATAVLVVLVLAVGACGDDGTEDADSSRDDGAGTAATAGDPADDGADAEDRGDPVDDGADDVDGGDPCGALDAPLVEAELGDTVGEGDGGDTSVTERGVTWTASECEWETVGGVELQLRMVDIGELPAECPALESPVYEISELPDLGDSAWWEWDALEGEGAVRVCTPRGMAESRVESPDDEPLDEDTVMAVAIAVVTPAVDVL